MANLRIGQFMGEIPSIAPKNLPNSNSQTALNCYLNSGAIEPSRAPLDLGLDLLASTKKLYWFNRESNAGAGYWLQFDNDNVDVVRGPIVNDSDLRTYVSGNGAPKLLTVTTAQSGAGPYPGASYDLGIPAPSVPPLALSPSGVMPEDSIAIETAYVITNVSALGEEGPPSSPSNIVTRWDGGTVALSSIEIPSGNFIASTKRIYRVELQGTYQFVAEIPASQTTFNDDVNTEFLAEPVPSSEWEPPHSSMVGLTSLPNGIMMGWWGNTIAFSEPYQPHAWPIRYRMTLDFDVVGAVHMPYGIAVITKGLPYVISGSSPESMGQSKLDSYHAGISKASIVDMGSYAIYASNDGLVALGGTEPKLIDAITSRQWKAFNPSTIRACRWDDRYLAFWGNSTTGGSFTFRPDEGFRFFDTWSEALFADDESGDVFIKTASNRLAKWDEGADQQYTWKSKEFDLPELKTFAAAKVDARSYPVTFKYFVKGVIEKTIAVNSNRAFRLPTSFVTDSCNFEVQGSAVIDSIQLASSMSEIM